MLDIYFLRTVAAQNRMIHPDTPLERVHRLVRHRGWCTRTLSLSDMNMDINKFKIINKYFPRLESVNVEGTYLNNTLICTTGEVHQYFRRPWMLQVKGLHVNLVEFFSRVTV